MSKKGNKTEKAVGYTPVPDRPIEPKPQDEQKPPKTDEQDGKKQ